MANPQERYDWILDYIANRSDGGVVDVLNMAFVDDYIEQFDAAHTISKPHGAFRCAQLSRDLLALYKQGFLERFTVGLGGSLNLFSKQPKWVYVYEIAKQNN